jgi:hypothetical protein
VSSPRPWSISASMRPRRARPSRSIGRHGVVHVEISDDGRGGAASTAPGFAAWPTGSPPSMGRSTFRPRGGRNAPRGGDPMRVILADDSVLLREGMARLLTEHGSGSPLGEVVVRPRGREPAREAPSGAESARCPDRARARGADPDGGGAFEPGDQQAARAQPAHRRDRRLVDLLEARPGAGRRTTAAACSRC